MPIPIQPVARVTYADRIRGVLSELDDDHLLTDEELAAQFSAPTVDAFYHRLTPTDKIAIREWRGKTSTGSFYYGTPKAIEKARAAGMVK